MNNRPIIKQLDELLSPRGFTRQKMTWNRAASPYVDVIDLQRSKAGDTLTVNAGVMHPWVHKVCWGEAQAAFVEEPSCTVRVRIGQLLDGKDIWWRPGNESVTAEIVESVRAHVLPFLDKMHSTRALIQQLVDAGATKNQYPLPAIYLAILSWEAGDAAGATTLLNDLRTRTVGAWQKRIDEVLDRLGNLKVH